MKLGAAMGAGWPPLGGVCWCALAGAAVEAAEDVEASEATEVAEAAEEVEVTEALDVEEAEEALSVEEEDCAETHQRKHTS